MGRKEKGDLVTLKEQTQVIPKGGAGTQSVLRCGVEPPAHQLPVDLHPGLFLIPATLRCLKSESSAPSSTEAALMAPLSM